jgi:hypothetical protein
MGSSGVRGCGAQVYAAAQAVLRAERSVTGVLLPVAAGDAAGMAPQQRKNLSDYPHAKFKGTSTRCAEAVALEHPCGAAIPHPALHVQVALCRTTPCCAPLWRVPAARWSLGKPPRARTGHRRGALGSTRAFSGVACPRCWRYNAV